MKLFTWLLLISLSAFVSACTTKTQAFENYESLEKSEVFKKWIPDFIPVEARKIQVWYDVESSLLTIDFLYEGSRPFHIQNMKVLNSSLKAEAIKSYPSLGTGSDIIEMQYKCSKHVIAPDSEPEATTVYTEVEFVGDTGKKIYYWNTHVPDTHKKICSST
jgi:hypothetical protein